MTRGELMGKKNTSWTVELDDAITHYLQEIARTPLLTGEQEAELAKKMVAGRRARARLRNMPANSADARRLQRVVERGEQARCKLIEANFRLVVSIAKRYRNHGVPFPDLIQEGNMGLMRAVDKFDYKRGFKFSTYATWWIRQSVARALADQARMIRLPVHAAEKVNKLSGLSQKLEQDLGRKPTATEMANKLGAPAHKVERLLQRSQQPLSLEMPMGEGGEATLGDVLADESSLTPTESVTRQLMSEDIRGVLSSLSPREEQILSLRYGLEDGQGRTLDEIGHELGYTRERIRQIETQALRKLRDAHTIKKLRGYLEN